MLRRFGLLAICLSLGGCVNTPGRSWGPLEVLDPTAYDPVENNADFDFNNTANAKPKLDALAKTYALHRDRAMEGALILDVPILGLAVTGIVGAANHFATTTTLGMLTGSGALLATRSYLGPSTKWAAYQGAENGLECLAQAATDLNGINIGNAQALLSELNKRRAASKSDKSISQSDLDNAAKASLDLTAALQTASDPYAAIQLSSAARAITQNATKRALTGLQDIGALTQAIQKVGAPATNSSAPSKPPSNPPQGAQQQTEQFPPQPPPDYSSLSLSQLTAAASGISTAINGIIAEIKTCITTSTS